MHFTTVLPLLLAALTATAAAAALPAAQITSYGYQGIDLAYCASADLKDCAYWTSGPGGRFASADRFEEGACTTLKAFDRRISSYTVEGGCCGFYAGDKCERLLWTANNKPAKELGAARDDKAESWKWNDGGGGYGMADRKGWEDWTGGLDVELGTEFWTNETVTMDGAGNKLLHETIIDITFPTKYYTITGPVPQCGSFLHVSILPSFLSIYLEFYGRQRTDRVGGWGLNFFFGWSERGIASEYAPQG
ncbi:hypothetical protein EDC01DRAFT_264028 [Geopyxis carbonaria]|nr:hypothetical protein EDC01DRAFT_264028 [Geopyxis carbonaria]